MEILRRAYETYVKKRFELEEEMKIYQAQRTIAEESNDLSENQDYEEAIRKLSELYAEHSKIVRLVTRADVIDLKTTSSTISVGALINLKVTYPGKLIEGSKKDNEGNVFLWYNVDKDVTVFQHDIVFGCPDDSFVDDFIWSTETNLFRYLENKTLGNYKYMTSQGVYMDIEVTRSKEGAICF